MANAAIHLYLAKKLKKKGLHSFSYFFGNLLPDTEFLIKCKEKLTFSKKHHASEHEEAPFLKKFQNKSLLQGMKLHFLVDNYIHHNYISKKIKKFRNYNPQLVHLLTEIVMDRILTKNYKKLKTFYNHLAQKVNLKRYGKKLEKTFPTRKFQGSLILKDGLEILRISNLTSWLKINKVRKLIQKYNPLKNINPSIIKVYFLTRKIEKDVEKELPSFLNRMITKLKKQV